MKKIHILIAMLCIILCISACANDTQVMKHEHTYKSERFEAGRRLALVIGNKNYVRYPLKNPINDAAKMAQTLKDLNFQVILKTDQNMEGMYKAVQEFGEALRYSEVGLFYYAGHGIQINGINYLMPIDADVRDESEVQYRAVDAGLILSKMEKVGNPLNILILDSCRDNPFISNDRGWQLAKSGLAPMQAPKGTKIIYAARPGKTAKDGNESNSPFTTQLIEQMKIPGMELEDMIRGVAKGVEDATDGDQIIWAEGIVPGNFYFLPAIVEKKPVIAVLPKSDLSEQAARKKFSEYEKEYQLSESQWIRLGEDDARYLAIRDKKSAEVIHILENIIENSDNLEDRYNTMLRNIEKFESDHGNAERMKEQLASLKKDLQNRIIWFFGNLWSSKNLINSIFCFRLFFKK